MFDTAIKETLEDVSEAHRAGAGGGGKRESGAAENLFFLNMFFLGGLGCVCGVVSMCFVFFFGLVVVFGLVWFGFRLLVGIVFVLVLICVCFVLFCCVSFPQGEFYFWGNGFVKVEKECMVISRF